MVHRGYGSISQRRHVNVHIRRHSTFYSRKDMGNVMKHLSGEPLLQQQLVLHVLAPGPGVGRSMASGRVTHRNGR